MRSIHNFLFCISITIGTSPPHGNSKIFLKFSKKLSIAIAIMQDSSSLTAKSSKVFASIYSEGATFACDDMRKSKDNRMIFGYYPAENFVNYGGKRMQNPPRNRQFNHPLDIFTVQELENFLEEMVPNFYQEIGSL